MVFVLKFRSDRLGTQILSILFQFYYCYINNLYIKYNINDNILNESFFLKAILFIIDNYNKNLVNSKIKIINNIENDFINIKGPGGTDMCFGMSTAVKLIKMDMLTYFKNNFYSKIENFIPENRYELPFDPDNTIVIHLRLDDQWWESDYDGIVCSKYYIDLINQDKNCFFSNGPNNKFNKQNPLSSDKIKMQLEILLNEFPYSKVILISSPLTEVPKMNFKYDFIIQNQDYNYDLFLLSKAKKIILSRSNFALISLFFGNHTHVHMPLWGHFACAGFGTKYDKCKFNYFY